MRFSNFQFWHRHKFTHSTINSGSVPKSDHQQTAIPKNQFSVFDNPNRRRMR